MAGFVQIIGYETSKPDEVHALSEEYDKAREAAGDGGSAPGSAMVCADRDNPGHYFTIVEFASAEAAMENSARADTSEYAAKMMELCDGPPTFYNLDLLEKM
ncbi:hypothetical protein F1D05_37795 [Kribbella qitaiheensis]|uniref:ABM domain-containing protein n=1 Tax=Kribbella qitaiheensis TaxID=1544730 RepID=A0A7G6X8N9_9ACTN|nr:hypothetical protein [Kribbella qitaiheensis]QNE22604.1 hypothetical protein F1D05_37795 [Kribbella qitaiheensis]